MRCISHTIHRGHTVNTRLQLWLLWYSMIHFKNVRILRTHKYYRYIFTLASATVVLNITFIHTHTTRVCFHSIVLFVYLGKVCTGKRHTHTRRRPRTINKCVFLWEKGLAKNYVLIQICLAAIPLRERVPCQVSCCWLLCYYYIMQRVVCTTSMV